MGKNKPTCVCVWVWVGGWGGVVGGRGRGHLLPRLLFSAVVAASGASWTRWRGSCRWGVACGWGSPASGRQRSAHLPPPRQEACCVTGPPHSPTRPPPLPPPPLQASPKSPKEGGDGKLGRLHPLLSALRRAVPPVLLESFTLTFLAEWGDRSQIATIGEGAGRAARLATFWGRGGHPLGQVPLPGRGAALGRPLSRVTRQQPPAATRPAHLPAPMLTPSCRPGRRLRRVWSDAGRHPGACHVHRRAPASGSAAAALALSAPAPRAL